MKSFISFLALMLFSIFTIHSQDIIVKHDGSEIQSKVLEVTDSSIKYKEFDFQDGPIRNIDKNTVFMIIYEGGKRETISAKKEETQKVEKPKSDYKGKYFMLGVGYGNSYGGSGVRFQFRTGGNVGFGMHAGVGYFEEAPVLYSAGFKFFPYQGLYINAQYGTVGWEATSGSFFNGSYTEYYYDDRVLHGPSLLLGGDWVWGDKVGFGFNAGVGATYYVNSEIDEIAVALDLGFIIRF